MRNILDWQPERMMWIRVLEASTGEGLDVWTALLGEYASVPTERAASVAVPALVMDGEASYPFMHATATALAQAIPLGQHRTLEGQTHEVTEGVLAPVLVDFFNSNST